MPSSSLKPTLLLLLAAAIWGFAFVAQRAGMAHVGPFTFNAVRFALGTLSLLPLLALERRRWADPAGAGSAREDARVDAGPDARGLVTGGALAGLVLFSGASLQQVGIVHTTAGKAGFITGLYVVLVPLLGLLWRQRTGAGTWAGALLATIGLYLLSVTGTFRMGRGDLLVLVSAFFWAGHVLLIGRLTRRLPAISLAAGQFTVCALLSLATALLLEHIDPDAILRAAIPILYGGLASVGVAYTLQVLAQRRAPAGHAALVLSLEAVFAVLGGMLLLGETLSARGLVGCALMLAGMLVSQLAAMARGKAFSPGASGSRSQPR